MLSTIPDSFSKQADIHLKLSMQPYHAIPQVTASDLLSNDWSACRRMERWRLADVWNSCQRWNFHAFAKKTLTSPPYRQIIQQNERMSHSMHWEVSSHPSPCSQIETGCYLPDIPCDESGNFSWLSLVFLHRLYFTLKKKAQAMSVTVSPCDIPIEWSLAARTLKDKPLKSLQCEWTVRPHACTFRYPLYLEDHH